MRLTAATLRKACRPTKRKSRPCDTKREPVPLLQVQRYFLDTFCHDNGGDFRLGLLGAASACRLTVCPCDSSVHSPPSGISVSHHLHRLSEIRPTVTRPIQCLCDILNVLLTHQKIPHSDGAVKRAMRRGHAAAPSTFRSCSNRANAI